MPLPIRALPIVEKWDCHGCTLCCRGTTIPLDKDDCEALRKQNWEAHPDFKRVRTVVRASWFGGRRILAKRPDGRCVFLSDEGRCRIHETHGAAAKPLVCQMFPLQLVPLDRHANVTTLRSCPSAAADRGRALDEHVRGLKKSNLLSRFATSRSAPPPIVRGSQRSWRDFLSAADALARLTTDPQLPLVRRLVHGLQFCSLLEDVKLNRVKVDDWHELMQLLEASATENAGVYFRDRQPPSTAAGSLLRQAGVHFIRAHPGFPMTGDWREGWRLMLLSARFARGHGPVPSIHPQFPETTFDQLDRPLGPLPSEVCLPLDRFFETHLTSKQYAVVRPKRSLIASYRELVLAFAIGLWLLRLAIGSREPTTQDVVDVVVTLQRGQGLAALGRGASTLASNQQLERLVAWFAR